MQIVAALIGVHCVHLPARAEELRAYVNRHALVTERRTAARLHLDMLVVYALVVIALCAAARNAAAVDCYRCAADGSQSAPPCTQAEIVECSGRVSCLTAYRNSNVIAKVWLLCDNRVA